MFLWTFRGYRHGVRTEATIKVFSKEFSGKATFSEK
jgi:hypothetical protein